MKNSLQLLALGLVLFLGACSTTEGDFLKKVEGKTMYYEASPATAVGAFSSDGKKLALVYNFVSASDENTATYAATFTAGKDTITIVTSDGKTGTYHSSATDETTKVLFK